MIELIFQKESALTKKVHQKSVIFVTIGTLKILVLSMNHIFAIAVTMLLLFFLKEVITGFILVYEQKWCN